MTSLQPELIHTFFNFPITNSVVATLLVDVVIVGLVIKVNRNVSLVPSGVQSIFEPVIEYLYNMAEGVSGSKVATFFPWFASFFFVILFSNLVGLLPGVGSIGFFETIKEHGKTIHEFIPLLRPSTSDFNMTLALGAVSVVATHVIAIKYNGIIGYLKKYFSLNPITLFIGILELILELVKVFSLSFRLFGNIFAGEVVLATVSGLFAFLAPIPFLMLESIVALVQALVFSMLTMVFMSILSTTSHEGGH